MTAATGTVGSTAHPAAQPPLIGLYLLAGLLTVATAAGWLVLDPIKYAVIEATADGHGLTSAALLALGDHWARVLAAMVAGLAGSVWLIWLEWRGRLLSAGIQAAPGLHFLILAAAVLLWLTHSYLYPGHILGGDAGSHIARLVHFGRGLQDGGALFWNNYYYMGAPFLQFYAPVFYWLGGIYYAVIGDAALAARLLLFTLHAASGLLFYAFLRTAGIGRAASLVGVIGYAGAWAHGQLIFYQGVLPQAVIMALLPAAFLLAERLLRGARPYGWCWVGLAVVSGGMLAAHQPHGIFGGVYLAIYVLARLAMIGFQWRLGLAIAAAGIAGVAMSLFAVVPFLIEQHWVMAEPGASFLQFRLPDASYWANLLIWNNGPTTSGARSDAYIGLSVALLALTAPILALLSGLRGRIGLWTIVVLAALAISLFWRGGLVRDIIFTLFFVSALAAAGADQAIDRMTRWPRLAMAILLVVLADLGSTALQPLPRADKAYLDQAGSHLAEAAADRRVMLTNTRDSNGEGGRLQTDVGPNGDPIQYYPVQTVGGPHNHAATLVHNYAVTMLMRAERDLRTDGALGDDARALLAMLNVGFIVNDTGRGMGFPSSLPTNAEAPALGRYIAIETATPAVFAPSLFARPPEPGLEESMVWRDDYLDAPTPMTERIDEFLSETLQAMAFRPDEAVADRLPVREPIDDAPASAAEAELSPPAGLRIDAYEVTADRVTLVATAPTDGWLQLAHPWYPTLAVDWNGEAIEPLRGAFNLLVVPALAGENLYSVRPYRSALRIASGVFCAATLLIVLIVPIYTSTIARRRRAAMPTDA